VLQFGDGDKSAVTSPHTVVREKGKDGDIVLTFKRFDMESKGEKVMREKSLHVKPTNEKPEELSRNQGVAHSGDSVRWQNAEGAVEER